MPSIEVGTVGGGTSLPAQAAALKMLGCQGANRDKTGANADSLAEVVAATVLAGEISLIAALATNDLLKAHIDLNRKKPTSEPAVESTAAKQQHQQQSTTRGLHTSNVVGHAITFGHPSTGGPNHAAARFPSTTSMFADEEPLYYAPGTRLLSMAPASALPHASTVATDMDEYGSNGPTLPVP